MLCDSKQRRDLFSARGSARGRKSALHRLDPRRPRPIFIRSVALPYQLAYRDKPRSRLREPSTSPRLIPFLDGPQRFSNPLGV